MNKKVLTKLRKWLAKADNSPLKLAMLLGYKSENSVKIWLKNNSIPCYMKSKVEEIITGEKL